MMRDKIWAFWEPKENIPGYLNLCVKTWSKLNREIVVLDDSNLDQYLSARETKLLRKTKHFYSLPQYADAVRVMILHRHGGIWMDLDTIILRPEKWLEIEKLKEKTDLLMIEKHIGWIWASKNSKIISEWHKAAMKKLDYPKWKINRDGAVKKYGRALKRLKWKVSNEPDKIQTQTDYINREIIGWDYIGNSIIDSLLNGASKRDYRSLTELYPYESFVPESETWGRNPEAIDKPAKYVDFYFNKKGKNVLGKSSVFLCLHNSWTPEKYKKMSAKEFLRTKTELANILRSAVDGKK